MHQVIDLCCQRYVNIVLLLICVVRYWIVMICSLEKRNYI